MAPKTREQRLFGAACLKVTLERSGGSAMNEIYKSTLDDLGVNADDVEEYLGQVREDVEAALDAGRPAVRK